MAGVKLRAVLHPEDGSEAAEEPYTPGAAGCGESEIHADEEAFGSICRHMRRSIARRGTGLVLGWWMGIRSRGRCRRGITRMGRKILVSRGAGANPRRADSAGVRSADGISGQLSDSGFGYASL